MPNALELHIEYRAPSELKPNPENPRLHSRRQIDQICRSISEFGFLVPVLIDDYGTLIAGHARALAARKIGLANVPTLRMSHLSDEQKIAFAIAENKLTENAKWDERLLAQQLKILAESDISFDAGITGFEPAEIDLLIEGLECSGTDQHDAADDLPVIHSSPVSRLGDLWLLDRHRLFCGNALEDGTYDTLMQGDRADMVFTDPPYNVPIDGHASGLGAVRHREFPMASGELDQEAFTSFLRSFLARAVAYAKKGAVFDVCMDWRHVLELTQASRAAGLGTLNIAVWVKTNAGMGSFYRSQHELVFILKAGPGPHQNNVELGRHGRNRTNVWTYSGATGFGRTSDEGNLLALHPTVKPVRLVADAILDCSKRRQIILDPFLGSGTTLIAADRVGRRCFGIELDALYVDTAIRRWQKFTGGQASLADDGRCFDEVEAGGRATS
jgi:DNA modification methylase